MRLTGGFGGWSSEGCWLDSDESTDTHTVCECNHLTNFAIMMVSVRDECVVWCAYVINYCFLIN